MTWITKTFPTEELAEMLCDGEGLVDGFELKLLKDKIVDKSRWSVLYEAVFSHGDKFYQLNYEKGATEYQDNGLFDGEQTVTCIQVEPKSVTVTKYLPVQKIND